MVDKDSEQFLETNIKGMMMTLLAHWNSQMDEQRARTEFADVRPADIRVFAQLRGRTMKLSAIHRELGYSRQAAQQAVARLVEHDMISVAPAQDNRRDRMISITRKGQRWRKLAAKEIKRIEEDCRRVIGESETETLRRLLFELLRHAEL